MTLYKNGQLKIAGKIDTSSIFKLNIENLNSYVLFLGFQKNITLKIALIRK
jgi:hypothetical protein